MRRAARGDQPPEAITIVPESGQVRLAEERAGVYRPEIEERVGTGEGEGEGVVVERPSVSFWLIGPGSHCSTEGCAFGHGHVNPCRDRYGKVLRACPVSRHCCLVDGHSGRCFVHDGRRIKEKPGSGSGSGRARTLSGLMDAGPDPDLRLGRD